MNTIHKMMGKQDDGMTLIELLITVAVIAIVFAIAVPVVLNITGGVSSDANSVSNQARADFSAQYFGALGASSVADAKYTYAVFNGRTLAKILNAPILGNQGVVTTLAGNGLATGVDGTGAAAGLGGITGVTTDPSGNVYTCSQIYHNIRKVTSAGVVTTFAGPTGGSGQWANVDGIGTAARFNSPYQMAVTPDGATMYVSDGSNSSIRKINMSTQAVTTVATGFFAPMGLALDSSGTNLWILDGNSIAKMVTATNTVSYLGMSGASLAYWPRGLAIDPANATLYVGGQGGNVINKIVIATGVTSVLAGSGTSGSVDGTGTGAQLNQPYGVVVDSTGTFLYFTEPYKVRKVEIATGIVTTVAGDGSAGTTDGQGSAAKFDGLRMMYRDSSNALYVAQYGGGSYLRKLV
jgi:prepilin-type N-terminal cleavage/methylation domain-containing protein